MSTLNGNYDDVLRRALHAAVESVEPSDSGLERIRERLARPRLLSFASFAAWYTDMAMRVTSWTEPATGPLLDAARPVVNRVRPAIDRVRPAVDRVRPVIDRFRPARAGLGHGSGRFGWLRPVAAMGTAIFVVAAGAFALMTLPQAMSPSGHITMPWNQKAPSGQPGQGAVKGASQIPAGPMLSPGAPIPLLPGTSKPASRCSAVGNSPQPSDTPVTSPSATSSPTVTPPIISPSATPDASPTPSDTEPSPTPTDSTTTATGTGTGSTPAPGLTPAPTVSGNSPLPRPAAQARKAVIIRPAADLRPAAVAGPSTSASASASTPPAASPCPSGSARSGPQALASARLAGLRSGTKSAGHDSVARGQAKQEGTISALGPAKAARATD